jgi:hypothetical protein
MKYRGKEKEYHKDYYRNHRQKLIDYLGGKCVRCGSTENLEFDHIDPSQKSFGISKSHLPFEKLKDELDKCQLLCKSCHKKKSNQELSIKFTKTGDQITHGIVATWMRRKCKCVICEAAKRKWNDERNSKRRSGNGRGKYRTKDEQNSGFCKNGHVMDDKNKSIVTRKNGNIDIRCKQCRNEEARLRRLNK